jgi:hypothetical protein
MFGLRIVNKIVKEYKIINIRLLPNMLLYSTRKHKKKCQINKYKLF